MRIKKWLSMIAASLLVFSSLPLTVSSAEKTAEEKAVGEYSSKDEVVYGNLDANGTIESMYVVNTFHITEPGEIVDYGDYTNLKNLTDLSAIEQSGEKVSFHAADEEFYYQGELTNKPLPWNIAITYLLDGEEIPADELAGQSGSLEIQIETSANKSVDPVFFENYLMQISLTLDPSIFSNIQAPKGTEANEGKHKQITFSVMPDTEEELIVTADVEDLEMDPINISAVPANIALEDPDISGMTKDMQKLSDAIGEIHSGVLELNNGISELNEGTAELSSGSAEYMDGIHELDESSNELVDGSREIRDILQQVSEAVQAGPDMPELGDLDELPDGLREMAEGLRESGDGLEELQDNYDEAYGALAEAINEIPDSDISEKQIKSLYKSNADQGVVDQLMATYQAAQKVKHTYSAAKQGFAAVSNTLDQVSEPLYDMADQLEVIADEMEKNMEDFETLDALVDLQEGLSELSSEYSSFHDGLVDYTEGVHALAMNYEDLDSGIQGLSEGTSELDSGAHELSEGTKELESSTHDIPEEMQSEIDELMDEYENEDFEPVSFVSDQNKDVGVVQFVLQTESIEIEEPEENDETSEDELSFWDRLLDLFR